MADCELCGEREATTYAIIEGVKLHVCSRCARFGKEIKERRKALVKPKSKHIERFVDVRDDFANIISKAIRERGIRFEDLAKSINESESYIRRIARGSTTPKIETAKKLERALGIKLLEEVRGQTESAEGEMTEGRITIGDIIEIKKKGVKNGGRT